MNKNTFAISGLEPVTISSNQEISPGVYLISYHSNAGFIPGQVVKIAIDRQHPPRIYSICSSKSNPEISILFNVKHDGLLTPKLSSSIPGDTIFVSQPYGSFTDTREPAWWIATGTGIAPFFSMASSGITKNKRLIHGVSYLNQFYLEDELEALLGDQYIRCCSRETSCNTFPGRVTDFLKSEKHFPQDIKYYLCGKALMVVEVRDLLIEKGIPYENILAEIYF